MKLVTAISSHNPSFKSNHQAVRSDSLVDGGGLGTHFVRPYAHAPIFWLFTPSHIQIHGFRPLCTSCLSIHQTMTLVLEKLPTCDEQIL